jgi:LysR family transcriptional regulator, low CO2-responsive transcriptional regulator
MSPPGQITTQQLQTFLRIAQAGSFSRAALFLDVTQPTISGRIRSLERTVGGPLFVRRGRRVTLTRRGEAFRAYAERALAVLDEGVLAAILGAAGQSGRVTLGVSDSALADSFLGAAVARFHRDHPAVEIVAEMASCEYLVAALHDRVVRLALLPWSHASPPYDALAPLLRFRERLQVVTSAGHPLAGKDDLTLEDVGQLAAPFLRLWWSQRSRRALDALGKLPGPVLEVPIQVARHTLLQHRGAALFAPSVIAHEIAAGTLVVLPVRDLPPIFCESALVVHQTAGDLPAPARAFVEVLRAEAGDLCVSE